MKNIIKFPLGLWVLLSASSSSLDARLHHLWFDDSSFFDSSWIDNVLDFQERSMTGLKERMSNWGPSKEEQEALKTAQTQLSNIKHEIVQDENKVSLTFSGFENLTRDAVKIVKKKNGLNGVITLTNGLVEFSIRKNGIHIVRRVELNKEQGDAEKKSVFYSSSSAAESERFENAIDLQTVKVESLKDTTLVITAEKKKEELLPIP